MGSTPPATQTPKFEKDNKQFADSGLRCIATTGNDDPATAKQSAELLETFFSGASFTNAMTDGKWHGLTREDWILIALCVVAWHARGQPDKPPPRIVDWKLALLDEFAAILMAGWYIYTRPWILTKHVYTAPRYECGVLKEDAAESAEKKRKREARNSKRKTDTAYEEAEHVDIHRAKGAPAFVTITTTFHLPSFIFQDSKHRLLKQSSVELTPAFTTAANLANILAQYEQAEIGRVTARNTEIILFAARVELCLAHATDVQKASYRTLGADGPSPLTDLEKRLIRPDFRGDVLLEFLSATAAAIAGSNLPTIYHV